jgi:hypothetical protein
MAIHLGPGWPGLDGVRLVDAIPFEALAARFKTLLAEDPSQR